MRKLVLFILGVLCIPVVLLAQRQLTGRVLGPNNTAVSSATVKVKNGKAATASGADGSFSLTVPNGPITLVVSSVNYQAREMHVAAGDNNITVPMALSDASLGEVVVTALGIKREKKSLGYAVQEVKGETLTAAKEPNLVNDLSGKVAGLQVVRSGNGPGGSSQIVLRGNNSLTGLSQPLIVVDGIPMENSTGRTGLGATNDFWSASPDMGNGLSDINADDIATLTVLKGPAAAALYGSLGGNGVILITTKSGKKQPGLGITVSSSIGFESIFTNPQMQNSYAQGSNGLYDSVSTSSWGPKITGQTITDWTGAKVPLQSYNNVGNYFKTGIISNQNVSFQQQFNSTGIFTSFNRMDNTSMIPGAKLTRNNITARAVTKFGNNERWTIDTKVQFINAVANNRSLEGQNGSIFATIDNMPRTLNILNFKNPLDTAGNMFWYTKGSGAVNPYWASQYNLNTDTRNRFLLNASLKHQFTNWLSAEVNAGGDLYTTNTESKLYAGGVSVPAGSYGMGKQTYQQTNYSTMVTARKDNLFGKWGASLMVGGNLMSWQNSAISGSAPQLVVPNLFTLTNSSGKANVSQGFSQKRINSVYSSAELNYGGYLFLNGTLRNDWSSALSKANRSFFYPSAGISWVFTEMMTRTGNNLPGWITFGKLRASFASAGSDLPPYQLYNTYYIGNDPNGNTTAGRNSVLYDPNVKSQLIKSYEAGAEMRLFQNRFGFDVAVYQSNATRQLIDLPTDPLSGYSAKKINAGNIQNKGVEVTADVRVLRNPNALNWTIGANYSSNNNTVVSIYPNVNKYLLAGYDNIQILAVAGQKFGEIYGSQIYRVTDKSDPAYGQMILTSNGLPQKAPGAVVRLGNQQAKGLVGVTNSFSYKGIGLDVLVDARLGGKIFSATLDNMQRSGTAAVTVPAGGRDSMVVTGVILDPTTNKYMANTNKISTQQYWGAVAGADNIGITEANLYDASNVRIRNVRLSYSLPQRLLGHGFVQRANFAISCNNVWLISSHMHGLDPESVYATGTPATGFENGSAPTSRTVFFSVTLGF